LGIPGLGPDGDLITEGQQEPAFQRIENKVGWWVGQGMGQRRADFTFGTNIVTEIEELNHAGSVANSD
jgi:hypothetical protein